MAERKTRHRGYLRTLAERLQEAGGRVMEAWRARARRRDPVGDISYRGLEVVHGGLELTVRSLSRLEHAVQPPHRAAKTVPHAPAASAPVRRRPQPPRRKSAPSAT